jgi:lipoyl-dependent peroxiredoxin
MLGIVHYVFLKRAYWRTARIYYAADSTSKCLVPRIIVKSNNVQNFKRGVNKMDALYTAKATAKGGRAGKVKSSDGVLDLDLAMPKSLGGDGSEGATNPEQLFAAGYAACFDSALNLVAGKEKKKIESEVSAEVSIGKDTDGGFKLGVTLSVSVSGVELDEAKQLVEKAHGVCPYSKATDGNIEVTLNTDTF